MDKCYNYNNAKKGAAVKVTAKPVKPLNPRSADTNAMGMEPTWTRQPTDNRISAFSHAFSWYNYFYGKKDAREMIVNYLELHGRKTDVRTLKRIPDSSIRLTTGWLCRMSMVGLELTDQEQIKLDNLLKEILDSKQDEVAEEVIVEDAVPRITIQDRLREKVSECAGEMDGLFDEFIASGAKLNADYKPVMLMRSMNIAPQMVNDIKQIWTRKLVEFDEAVAGKDADLVQGYGYLSKVQLRNCVKFCELVISDCGAYVQIKKVERKPRAKKAISPEKLSSKFKYLKDFAELKLVSQTTASLVNASEAWLYDTKKRKLIHVLADAHVGSFTIKGTSIVAFDAVNSSQKTLRKPAEQIKSIVSVGKPAARKVYKDIKSTEIQFNGRGNENLIILKSW
jgi:hypothetical protein